MRILITLGLLACTACFSAGAQDTAEKEDSTRAAEPGDANTLTVRESWVESVDIAVAESAPPQFTATLTVQMPTPGWKLKIDEVSKPDELGRIQARIIGTPPEGMVAQVITSEKINVALDSLKQGEYLLEIHYRTAGETTYARRAAVMLSAGK